MIWDEILQLTNRAIPEARFNLEKAYANVTRCTAAISGMPGGHQPGSTIERNWALIEKREDELQRLLYRLDELRALAVPLIATLESPKEKYAMCMRYLEGKTMIEIREALQLSTNYAYGLIYRAIKRLESVMDTESHADDCTAS